jgi:hypothetical protein
MSNSSLVRVIVLLAGSEKLIVSPAVAALIACRSEPGPLSAVLVTVMVAACPAAARLSSVMAIR